ncbi:MAG: hypothetical protein MZV65_43590 [Chromatiales bacterium]|nr:hypothetical protein [Chromatiales bacterium]
MTKPRDYEYDEAFRWSYSLKQLSAAYEIATNYGPISLDAELHQAVERAVRPILEQRRRQAERRAQLQAPGESEEARP